MNWELLHALPSFIDLLALSLLAGVTVSLTSVVPALNDADRGAVIPSLHRWAGISVALSFLASLLILTQKTIEMSGQNLLGAITVLPVMVFETHYGKVWSLWIGALALLVFTIWRSRRRIGLRQFNVLAWVGTATIAWTHSASGHAADGGDFTVKQGLDCLHIVAGGVWLGGLAVFVFAILPALRDRPQNQILFTVLLKRLSRLALVAFLIVLGTGIYNIRQHVHALSLLWQGHYGVILTLKLILVTGMLVLAIVNRYAHMPRLEPNPGPRIKGYGERSGGIATTGVNPRFRHDIQRLLILETILGVGVLYLVATLIHERPPM